MKSNLDFLYIYYINWIIEKMFEGVLEKILQEKLGKFLEGFDKQNLSVGVSALNVT